VTSHSSILWPITTTKSRGSRFTVCVYWEILVKCLAAWEFFNCASLIFDAASSFTIKIKKIGEKLLNSEVIFHVILCLFYFILYTLWFKKRFKIIKAPIFKENFKTKLYSGLKLAAHVVSYLLSIKDNSEASVKKFAIY